MKLPHELNLKIAGKVAIVTDPETGEHADYVYQRTARTKGNLPSQGRYGLQLRRHVAARTPHHPNQDAARARIAAGTAAYQALSARKRAEWANRAQGKSVTGYQLFMRQYCRNHPLTEYL